MKIFESLKNIGKYKVEKNTMSLKELEKEIENAKKKSIQEDSYLLLASSWGIEKLRGIKDSKSRRYFYNLYKQWDDAGYIKLEDGKNLESLLENMNLGVHHIGFTFDLTDIENNEIVHNIIDNGLKNMGDLMRGMMFTDDVSLSKTIAQINNPLQMVMHLKGSYKNSNTKFIFAFPKELVDKDMHFTNGDSVKQIYDYIDGIPHVKPEFIVSFYTNDNGICKHYNKEDFKTKLSK